MATPDVQLLSAVISPWWAAFSVLTGLLMACASALADLVQGDHADDVPPLAIALVVLLSTAAVFDMITHRLAYYRADIYVTYR